MFKYLAGVILGLFLWGHELANSFRLFRLHSSFFTNDDEFFIKTKITFFVNVAVGFAFKISIITWKSCKNQTNLNCFQLQTTS